MSSEAANPVRPRVGAVATTRSRGRRAWNCEGQGGCFMPPPPLLDALEDDAEAKSGK